MKESQSDIDLRIMDFHIKIKKSFKFQVNTSENVKKIMCASSVNFCINTNLNEKINLYNKRRKTKLLQKS